MTLFRRTAGIWGPATFSVAAVLAGRIQPGYSHVGHHISGLAAARQRSAIVMVPGFVALAAASALMPVSDPAVARLARIAGAGVLGAGLVPASQPRCPQPGVDPEATMSDVGHGIASITAFVAWTATPYVASSTLGPAWYQGLSRTLRVTTTAGLLGAAGTTRFDAPIKGLAQRAFLGSVFAWYLATAARTLVRSDT